MDQLGRVQAVDRLSQRVVVAVAAATNRRFDSRFGQALAIANADVLRTPIGVVDERSIDYGLTSRFKAITPS